MNEHEPLFYAAAPATWTCPHCGHSVVFERLDAPTDMAYCLTSTCKSCGNKASLMANLDPPAPPQGHTSWLFSGAQ